MIGRHAGRHGRATGVIPNRQESPGSRSVAIVEIVCLVMAPILALSLPGCAVHDERPAERRDAPDHSRSFRDAHGAGESGTDSERPRSSAASDRPRSSGGKESETSVGAGAPEDEGAEPESEKPRVNVGGAVRVNYFYKTWDGENKDRSGELEFDTFRVNFDAAYKDLTGSAEYRFYSGYNMLHHGYAGYTFREEAEVQLGIHKVPFGLLPYASHNWFFDLPYYLGLEDDYDAGVKGIYRTGPFDLQLAFYKNDEGSYSGDSIDSARYSYDIVNTDDTELPGVGKRTNEEVNQVNGRFAYTLEHGMDLSTEIGVSGEWGQIFNDTTDREGHHWASALHVNGNYGRVNLMLQAARYEFHPKNPAGQDDEFIVLGAYDAPYKVAAEAWVFVANAAYTLPVHKGPIDTLTFYSDYSYLLKDESDFRDSEQLVLGTLVTAGPVLTYIDFALGRNHPWIGPDYGNALAEGADDDDWELRFNVNLGIYF